MSLRHILIEKLQRAFTPLHLEVRDDSRLHAGHAGAHPAGESHFYIEMVAAAFTGQSRTACHRAVHSVLAAELAGERLHALSLRLRSPGEDEAAVTEGTREPRGA